MKYCHCFLRRKDREGCMDEEERKMTRRSDGVYETAESIALGGRGLY